MARFGSLLAVAIGGIVGSLARWSVVSAVSPDRTTIAVLGLNIVGSVFLGALLAQREWLSNEQYSLLGAGFTGGLTTFSTYAVSVAEQLEDGALLPAVANGIGTLVLTLLGGGVGFRISRLVGLRLLSRPRSSQQFGRAGR